MSFQRRWTDEQKNTIVRLVVNDHCTVREAVIRARNGATGLPPFDMPEGTAYDLVAKARNPAPATRDPLASVRQTTARALALAEQTVQQELDKQENADTALLDRWAQLVVPLTQALETLGPDDNEDHASPGTDNRESDSTPDPTTTENNTTAGLCDDRPIWLVA